MAPSKAVFTQIVQAFESHMDAHTSVRGIDAASDPTTDSTPTELSTDFDDSDEHVDLIEFPSDGSNIGIAIWLFLFPLRFLMHYTMPDVRQLDRNGNPMSTIGYAYLATLSCLVWLIMGSYAMVASLEKLADLMDVPDSLVGVTVSAAGKDSRTHEPRNPNHILNIVPFALQVHRFRITSPLRWPLRMGLEIKLCRTPLARTHSILWSV
jgi:hypothetical protein